MKIVIDGWLGLAAFITVTFWAIALLVQMITGRYWPKKIIKVNYERMVCAGCGKAIGEHWHAMCSNECKEVVKDSTE